MIDKTDKYIRIIISLTVVIILIIIIILNVTYKNALQLTKNHFKEHQLLLAAQTASGIENRLNSLVRELDIISRMPSVIKMDISKVREIFAAEFAYLKKMNVIDIALMNSRGIIKFPFKSKELLNRDFSFRSYYKRSVELTTHTPVYEFVTFEGIKSGNKGIVIAMPVFSKSETFRGLVIFVIDIKELLSGFFPVPMKKTFYWVMDSDLNILYHPEFATGTNVGGITGNQPAFEKFIRSVMNHSRFTGDYTCPTGSSFIGSSISIKTGKKKWYAIVSTYEEHVYELLEHITVVYGIISIIAIGVIVFCSVIVINFTKRWNYELQNEIDERRKIEQALRESEKRFKTIINQASDCILIMECSDDKMPVIVEANIAACEMHGYTKEELIGKPISFLDDPDTAKLAKERSEILFRERRIHFEGGHVRKDGSTFPVEVTAQLIDLEGRPHIMAIDRDITERKNSELALLKARNEMESRVKERTAQLSEANLLLQQEIAERKDAEKKLREQHEFIKNVIDSLTHPFYVVDAADYSIILANSAAGINQEEDELKCYRLIHRKDEPCGKSNLPCTIDEIKKNKKPVILNYTYTDAEGKKRFIQTHGFPIFDEDSNIEQVIEYTIDTTEYKMLEDRLARTQKMESIGRLAGGIAHDFNNILSVILTYCELAMAKIPGNDAVYKDIMTISDASDRAALLIKQLLAFSRKQRLRIKVINVNEVIKNTYAMLERVIGDDIVIELNLDNSLKNIEADPVQIEQILMNIAVNARDAMPEGGRLFIETSNIESAGHFNGGDDTARADLILISITDTGIGMTGEVAEKIFEPFFTTKDNLGTGLGLSTVYGIVKQHNGSIAVYSEKGSGTTFKIYFPASAGEADYDTGGEDEFKEEKTVLTGDEIILAVDDESSILKLIVDTLQPLGYKILPASSGEEAIDICRGFEGRIDLLLTDVVMPHMKGTELAGIIEKEIPSIKILFISGYADETVLNRDILNAGYQLMQKPLTPVRLLKKIREVLDKKPAGTQK